MYCWNGIFFSVRAEEFQGRQLGQPSQFCTGKRRLGAREAEDSPLLETLARTLLLKTQQAGKRLAGGGDL
jgi:hypothetical protein